MDGRLRMSLMPCGVAAESCGGGEPSDDRAPAAWGLRPAGVGEPSGGDGEAEAEEEDDGEEEDGDSDSDREEGPLGAPVTAAAAGGRGYAAAGYSGVFISAMLCRAASGGLLSRKALCRGEPSICPTASIPGPGSDGDPARKRRCWRGGRPESVRAAPNGRGCVCPP